MNEIVRRRRAAFLLRERAADALDQAAALDGLPAMRILRVDVERIAAAIGMDPDALTDVVMGLWDSDETS
jgi:hypothetical protein